MRSTCNQGALNKSLKRDLHEMKQKVMKSV